MFHVEIVFYVKFEKAKLQVKKKKKNTMSTVIITILLQRIDQILCLSDLLGIHQSLLCELTWLHVRVVSIINQKFTKQKTLFDTF